MQSFSRHLPATNSKTKMPKHKPTALPYTKEAVEQEQLFSWANFARGKYQELDLLYHIPNGGKRNPSEAAHLKRQGVKAGVPDLCLPVARGKYHGLYIELKAGSNKPTQAQNDWIAALNEQGYKAVVCYGCEQAINVLKNYLEMGQQDEIK